MPFINPHQRCGYSDSPFARMHFFYTARSGNGLEGPDSVCPPKLTLRKRHFFVIEKYVGDAKQDAKHLPDLLESIMRRNCLVKEKLRPILIKMDQSSSKITKIWVRPNSSKPQNWFAKQPSPIFEAANPFSRYLAPLGAKYFNKCGF